jgi:hypothetical protein
MSTTQSAYDWLRARIKPAERAPGDSGARAYSDPEPERGGRAEIERMLEEVEHLVGRGRNAEPREAVDTALEAVARLQVVTANVDACKPPTGPHLERALQSYADKRLMGHADAIERGMTYTSDNTMRLLRGEK